MHLTLHTRPSRTDRATAINMYCDRGSCRRGFGDQITLDRHLRIHDNNLIYCYFCPWGGVRTDQFLMHMNHHYHFKPVKCPFCEKTFYDKNHCKVHQERLHDKIDDRYKCKLCDFVTYENVLYYRHQRASHSQQ